MSVGADIRLACNVLDLERLVVHADVVRRHVERASVFGEYAAGCWSFAAEAPPGTCPSVLTSWPFLSVL